MIATVFGSATGIIVFLKNGGAIEMAQYMAGHVAPPKIRVFPNRDAPLRLATAALVEIDEGWATLDRIYIN